MDTLASRARQTSGSRNKVCKTLDARRLVRSARNPTTWASLATEVVRSAHVRRADGTRADIQAADLPRRLSGRTVGAGTRLSGIGVCSGCARHTSSAVRGPRGSSRARHAMGTVTDLTDAARLARACVLVARGRNASKHTLGAGLVHAPTELISRGSEK